MTRRAFLEQWFHRVWTEENAEAITELFVPESGEGATGIYQDEAIDTTDYVAFHRTLLALLQGVEISIDNYIGEGDFAAAECTLTALDRKTETQRVSTRGCVMVKIVDGKIRYASNHFDFLTLFEGLGLLPAGTFVSCLGGNRVAWREV